MNLSGESVSEAVRFYKLPVDRVVVFHDDLDLDLARIKIKQGGGNAGHNGLKSMQQLLGSPDFVRVRLGIGKPVAGQDPAAFVLAPFPASERALVDPVLDALPNLLSSILDGDYAGVLNRLAQLRVPVLNSKPLSG
jgi:PTH1 family peptidyl-tRNA hydrolase